MKSHYGDEYMAVKQSSCQSMLRNPWILNKTPSNGDFADINMHIISRKEEIERWQSQKEKSKKIYFRRRTLTFND